MSIYVVDQLAPGDHVCWIFERDADYLPAMERFVEAGLHEHERVLYLTGDDSPDLLGGGLGDQERGVPEAVRSGQLRLYPARDVYLAGGRFDPAGVTAAFSRDIDQAVADGYRGLRVVADMGWASEQGGLAGYEERVNRLFVDGRALGVCLYDRRLFDTGTLRAGSRAHPGTLGPRVADDWTPLLRIRRTGRSEVTLAGEADLSNRRALAAVLDLVVADATAEPIQLEVSGLTFLDAGSAGLLARAAGTAPGGLRFLGGTPAVRQVLALTGILTLPGVDAP